MRSFVLAAALAAASLPAPAAEQLAGPYHAQILRVIDGDTVEARIRVWLGLDLIILVRLRGIDTPELRGPCPAEALAARDALARLVGAGPVVLTDISHDKYGGRVDASLHLPSGESAGAALLAAGLARPIGADGKRPFCARPRTDY